MTTLFARDALLPEGWSENVLVEIDKDGWIVGVDTFKKEPEPDSGAEVVAGPLVPGLVNAHSHAFQRGMAGMSERAGGKKETFWNWRETLYRFTARIGPEEMEALAAQAFVEMLKAGYTSVCEFHYVHHQPGGQPYDEPAVMGRGIVRAALEAGIGLALFPALYAHSGFGGKPPEEAQKRFVNDVPALMRIIEELYAEFRTASQVTMGFAHHSLRAVPPEMLREGTRAMRNLIPDAPVHILVAGQAAEVEDCVAWSGKRPVAWLLDSGEVDENWTLVHCTNVDEAEARALAASGAVAALCPSAEANAGGGIFPLAAYFAAGGRFAVGTGGNILVSAMEELRWLEYVQRLVRQERTIIQSPEIPSVGAALFEEALKGGARAAGRKTGRIEPGCRADLLVLDPDLPSMAGRVRDHILDSAVFSAGRNPVRDVMAGGRWAVRDRKHRREEQVLENFRKALEKMG